MRANPAYREVAKQGIKLMSCSHNMSVRGVRSASISFPIIFGPLLRCSAKINFHSVPVIVVLAAELKQPPKNSIQKWMNAYSAFPWWFLSTVLFQGVVTCFRVWFPWLDYVSLMSSESVTQTWALLHDVSDANHRSLLPAVTLSRKHNLLIISCEINLIHGLAGSLA